MNDILLIDVLFSLALTIFAYLLVPIIYVIRKKVLTHKQIKKIIIINGAVVWAILKIIILSTTGTASSSGAVFLWSAVGYCLLKKKCLKEDTPPVIQTETSLPTNISFKDHINEVQGETIPNPNTEQPLPDYHKQTSPTSTTPRKSNGKTIAIIILSVLLVISSVFCILIIIENASIAEEYETRISELEEKLESKTSAYNSAHESLVKYREYYEDNYAKVDMMNSGIVFVIEGYGNYYYTYDQMMIATLGDAEYAYWAYNIEQAQGLGYIPWK